MAAVVAFPMSPDGARCALCLRPSSTHRVNGRWVACRQDAVIGVDQATRDRRARLAQLQPRVLKVKPFGIDVEGVS